MFEKVKIREDFIVSNIKKNIMKSHIYDDVLKDAVNKKSAQEEIREFKANEIKSHAENLRTLIASRRKVLETGIKDNMTPEALLKKCLEDEQANGIINNSQYIEMAISETSQTESLLIEEKMQKLTNVEFAKWFDNYLSTILVKPIEEAAKKIFLEYLRPKDSKELYFYLVALYICYSMPLTLKVEQYIDFIAMDLYLMVGQYLHLGDIDLDKDFRVDKVTKSHRKNRTKRINAFKKIWEEKIKTDPKWLKYTKTPTERVRYIISKIDKDFKVTKKTGLKYLREIEKGREKI